MRSNLQESGGVWKNCLDAPKRRLEEFSREMRSGIVSNEALRPHAAKLCEHLHDWFYTQTLCFFEVKMITEGEPKWDLSVIWDLLQRIYRVGRSHVWGNIREKQLHRFLVRRNTPKLLWDVIPLLYVHGGAKQKNELNESFLQNAFLDNFLGVDILCQWLIELSPFSSVFVLCRKILILSSSVPDCCPLNSWG